ncbi:CapA family protein [Guyparkeria hydrothermalis]|uniref:CapA family protein n=1 Tax=Guyparkeria hydrothermalis TaxID=923 RepID=UPI00201FD064|nr:CapA family protein [Guyparkeria hydrothermalis]MCL7744136.1 CapA family protein [Guyparkeria hydrothermalis]
MSTPATARSSGELPLLFGGDVMLGRGIDQILPSPSDPVLYEDYIKDARGYLRLAERANGPVPRAVGPGYVWGAARDTLADPARRRILNLETAITTSATPWPDKGIHYRMHPANIACLTAVSPDCLVLANNHVLDWGRAGLTETLETLEAAGIPFVGAGRDHEEAARPTVLAGANGQRLLVFAVGHGDSGVPADWAATTDRSGVHYLPDLDDEAIERLADLVDSHRRPGDTVVFSIHWGSNWGYQIPEAHRRFAHALIDVAGIDLVHGHSSHHPRAFEVHNERLILYGCGDLINDYEGIGGTAPYRSDLAVLYRSTLRNGQLHALELDPFAIRRLQLQSCSRPDREWLAGMLDRQAQRFGGEVSDTGTRLVCHWDG